MSLWLGAALIVALPQAATAAEQARPGQYIPGETIDNFYAARNGQPLWFGRDNDGAAAQALYDLISDARADGLAPESYAPHEL